MRVRTTQRLVALAIPGAFLLALGLRCSLLHRYASDLPFHDQWDAEGLHLLRPWKAGADLGPFLLRFHNEHHPVLTKLIALGLAAFDGMWSALPQLLVNTLFQGFIVVLLSRLARRHLAPRAAWLVTVSAAVLLSLPVLWENLLWGFQTQFYLAILLGLVHLDLTWSAPRLGWRWMAGMGAGLLTLGTFAAGFLPVLASGLVALLRLRQTGPVRRHALATLAVAAGVTAVGIHLINPVPYPAVARTPFSALEAYFILGGWPLGTGAAIFLLQLPALLLLAGQAWRDGPRPSQPWLVALIVWLAAATAAFAVGRAELIDGATPRYCDFLAVQFLVGVVCVLQLASAQVHRPGVARLAAGLWLAAIAAGFVLAVRTTDARDELGQRAALQATQQKLVRAFVVAGDPEVLGSSRPARLIHESPEQRAALLRDPGLRSLLPSSVRAPLGVVSAGETRDFSRRPFYAPDLLSAGWTSAPDSAQGARFLSEMIKPEPFPLLRFRVSGGVDGQTHRLRLLVGDAATPVEPLAGTHGTNPQYINFPMPAGPFRIEAAAAVGSLPLTFSDPVALSRLSWLSGKIFGAHLYFSLAGGFLLALAGVGAWLTVPGTRGTEARPVSPRRVRAVAGVGAVLLASAGLLAWPRPLVVGAGARARTLLNPAAWSAHAADGFGLSGPEAGDRPAQAGQVYPTITSPGRFYGTYGTGGDADTSRSISTSFLVDANWLCIPVVGYPAQPGNSLVVEVLKENGDVDGAFRFEGANPAERPQLWLLDVALHRGQHARVRCVDGETGHQGWLGFSTPWLLDDPANLGSWQRLADSDRLLWLRYALVVGGVAAALVWFCESRRPAVGESGAGWLWP